jgi:predicted nucleotidyltransferase
MYPLTVEMKKAIKIPGSSERISSRSRDRSLRKIAPHIPPHILKIIQRFARDTKHILQENVIAEYLFGSYATNTYTPLSDIDILIVVNRFTPEIRREMSGLASEYSLEYDVYISPIIKDYQVWNKNKQYHTLFYQEVTRHGIRL